MGIRTIILLDGRTYGIGFQTETVTMSFVDSGVISESIADGDVAGAWI